MLIMPLAYRIRDVLLLSFVVCFTSEAIAGRRNVPTPLAPHPGNIFLTSEEITMPVPGSAGEWRLVDYEGEAVMRGMAAGGKATIGRLPPGFYRMDLTGATNALSLGVLAPLQAPTPLDSPICIDVAMAWFYGAERMDAVANLCTLAGINWVRDRLTWAEMEPEKGQFASTNRYDLSVGAQARAGLRVLDVIHLSPSWANTNTKRFPLDLRDAYRFYEAMARRWSGQVQAFEPWNEADIEMFGGHTGSEMASLQKAAYLGLKAGNPQITACLNVFALHNPAQLQDFNANEAWPYFDTFNFHHYAPFDEYPKLYADFRDISAGKPLWVTECSLPVKWAGNEDLQEPTDADLKEQSERVAKTFACSLHEGTAATFYFLLPHFVEGQTQFGIIHRDLSPRPAYVALAAVGRLLAEATPLGRWTGQVEGVRAYLFRAQPDGQLKDVLVGWTSQPADVTLPTAPLEVLDHLGRAQKSTRTLRLDHAPVFALLPIGTATKLPLAPPPAAPRLRIGTPSPVVLQALWPEKQLDLNRSAYRVAVEQPQAIPVFVYNFGQKPVSGSLRVEHASGVEIKFASEVEVAPGGRIELPLVLKMPGQISETASTIRIVGEFGAAGTAILSLRFVR
jgi:hypothetical protein